MVHEGKYCYRSGLCIGKDWNVVRSPSYVRDFSGITWQEKDGDMYGAWGMDVRYKVVVGVFGQSGS